MNCDFCGAEIGEGKGTLYVKKTGKKFFFCSNKCEKNMIKLKRSPRKTKWTEEYHKVKIRERTGGKKSNEKK